MDERLNRSNRLPGSEKLTRPEEIGQLSKYLKSIKEVYEESTRLEDQVLGISGYSTGKIPIIDSLGKKTIKTPENQGETPDLSQKILGVPGKRKEDKLEKKRIDLEDNRKNRLEKDAVKAPDNHGGEVSRLGEVIKKIQDVRNQNLEEKRLNLLDERQIALEDTRLDLQAMINASLRDKRIDLSDNRDTKLEDTKLNLTDPRQPELEDKRLNLKDEREPKLSDKIIGLKEPEEIELEDKRLDIKDEGVNSLETKRINLSAEENIELGDKRINLEGPEEVKLGDKRLDLSDNRQNKLEDKRINIENLEEPELENKRIGIKDERDIELGDKRIDIRDENDPSLSDKIIGLNDDREQALSDKRLDLKDDRENELGNKRLNLTDERENELADKILELKDEREPELEDTRIDLTDDKENELEDKRLDLKDNRENSLSDKILGILENENGEPTELYDSFIGAPENENGEPTELYDAFLGMAENQGGGVTELEDKIVEGIENQGEEVGDLEDKRLDIDDQRDISLSDKILGIAENQGTAPDITNINIESIRDYTAKLSDAELYEFAMGLASEGDKASGEHNGWMEKVSSLMSAYLSSDILTPKRAIEFRDAINNTLEMSYFGSQAALRVPVDTSSDTIWAKAEEAVGEQITGTNRRDALDEMIVKMVDYKKSNLPRLPGSDLVDAAKGAVKNVIGTITGNSSHPNPMNKPLHMSGMAIPGGYGDTVYQAANNRTNFNTINEVGDVIGTAFYDRYWSAKSFKTTLEDLCPIVGKAPVVSLAELKALMKASPYITTPGKFMTDSKGSYNTMTLDTNMYWEILIEPYCSSSGNCSNGGFSYLPSIKEINFENEKIHKVSTNYGFWAPINSFELQKSKLQTKSLSLYEGEISYPTGMEFTNELRLTFVDDSWKSWRRYFEKCAQVAVFNSYPHKATYYSMPISEAEVTVVDKSNVCIAPYKNIAFNIRIYILNPQFNSIKKYNLLCILKDFSEEYVGEVDSGGTDLNVSFSIVGENPEEDKKKTYAVAAEAVFSLTQQALLETQKRVTGAINASIGLL